MNPAPKSKAIVARTKEAGLPLSAASVVRKPLPDATWWDIISRSAKSGNPYSAIADLAALLNPELQRWPEGMYEWDESLPGIAQAEALGDMDSCEVVFLRTWLRPQTIEVAGFFETV